MYVRHEKYIFNIGNSIIFPFTNQESHVGEIGDLRSDKDYTIAFGGKLNAYKLFIANAVKKLLSTNCINCFIFQNSFLGDRQATNLRKYILKNDKIVKIDSFPERDSKKKLNRKTLEFFGFSVNCAYSTNVLPESRKIPQ